MKQSGPLNADPQQLIDKWGVRIDPELLVLCLTHRSFANEQGGLPHNERLEFLGDSVLSIIVTDWLFHHFPQKPESTLAKMRSATVSQPPLAQTARELGLGDYILLGVGENKTGGRDKDSILSDTLEALIGATYLSNGLEPTRKVVLKALNPLLEAVEARAVTVDWKTRIQEYASENGVTVTYESEGDGPDHARIFTSHVLIDGEIVGTAVDSPKRHAENLAARQALIALIGPEADPTLAASTQG